MKVKYDDILFDSDLEVEYYKYLKNSKDVKELIYHPKEPIHITISNNYTPDFIVGYEDRIEVIETKGYNQFSYMRDSIIHNYMLNLSESELKSYVEMTGFDTSNRRIIYRKIKYLKSYGFVEWDFKNPNTLANKRKEKINQLNDELKELKAFKKDTIRYWKLFIKSIAEPKKVTKSQEEFMDKYSKELNEYLKEESKK